MLENHVIYLRNGMLADTSQAKVREIIAHAASNGRDGRIVVHFHGGLVTRSAGTAIAERLKPDYEDSGAYPIFLVWESGLLETISNNFGEISGERLFRLLWKRIANLARRKIAQDADSRGAQALPQIDSTEDDRVIDTVLDGGDAAALEGAEPVAHITVGELSAFERITMEHELSLDVELLMEVKAISNGLRPPADIERDLTVRGTAYTRASSATLMDPRAIERLVERPEPGSRGLISTARLVKAVVAVSARVISRFVGKRDHGFHATVVEEILREFYFATVGGIIWSTMKKDTWDSFGDDPERHGGTALLHALNDAIETGATPRVCLVGHSTGAVYISAFIDKADRVLPAGVRFEILFLAPASTFDLVATTIDQYRDRIADFRMFTMTDENERKDRLVPLLYPHSLLYFVSGVVEDTADTPIVGMKRYYDPARYADGDFPSVKSVREFVNGEGRAVWSVENGGDGLNCRAVTHTDFDAETTTIASIKHILRNGF